jgi:Holliday junction resolvase
MPETEAELVKKIVKTLCEQPLTEAMKIHGDMYQERGIPDILCCHKGKFYAFEVKRPGKEKNVSKYQELKLSRIRKARGIAVVISSMDEALYFIK